MHQTGEHIHGFEPREVIWPNVDQNAAHSQTLAAARVIRGARRDAFMTRSACSGVHSTGALQQPTPQPLWRSVAGFDVLAMHVNYAMLVADLNRKQSFLCVFLRMPSSHAP